MARRKRDAEQQPAQHRREPQADDLYEVGLWHGVAHYRCRLCPFDTLRADAMLEHAAGHGPRANDAG